MASTTLARSLGATATLRSAPDHGFLFSGGIYATIDVPGAFITQVLGINDAGQIVGAYYSSSDSASGTGFVSTAPVPAALPLFASGLGGMGLMGWWRRRRRGQAAHA